MASRTIPRPTKSNSPPHAIPESPENAHTKPTVVKLAAGSIRNVAVAALTKTLADELGPKGINVTVVHPGWTVTERTGDHIAAYASARGITEAVAQVMLAKGIGIGRPVTAAELATVVTFLASPRSVAINGDAIAAGGGARGPIHY